MKQVIFIFLMLFTLNVFASLTRVVDSEGHEFELTQPTHRIITLAPNLTEIVFAAGAEQYLVGVSAESDYPKAALKIPIIASYQEVDLEKIVSLRPDLVIAWQYSNTLMVQKLKQLKIPVYMASFSRLFDIPKAIEDVGKLAGTYPYAAKSVKKFKAELIRLGQKYSHRKPVKVFFQLSQTPLMTLNKRSVVNSVIELCGGKNLFKKALGFSPSVSIEDVLKLNPQVILESVFSDKNKVFDYWKKYPEIQAVKNRRIYFVNPSLIERPGPRILQGAAIICRDIHAK